MFIRREHLAALVVAVSLAASAQPSHAQWPVNGVPLCTAVYNQSHQTMVTDGAGGAIVTWIDQRSGGYYGIYAQHVLGSGAVDPVWTAANGNADGTPLCTVASGKGAPTIVADGAGGAIVTWADGRNNTGNYNNDIYAQHVLASGVVDPAWTTANGNPDGTPLCTDLSLQGEPTIVTDGAGGAIVTWTDARPTDSYYQIYAQHLLASGAVDPAWPVDGSRVSGGGTTPMIAPDGAGGAIVTWVNAYGAGIYAQHLLASGTVDSVWTNANGNANGTPLCTPTEYQIPAMIVEDGSRGAIVTWADVWAGRIYAQRVNAAGVVQWIPDGVALCTASGQSSPAIEPDGAGGAIVTWDDLRNADGTNDIYAQHLLASGAVDVAWPANGLEVCTAVGDQYTPMIVTDGAGGAIVTWQDGRPMDNSSDIYAQHVLALGAVDPAWPVNGRGLCTEASTQPIIATDGLGGAIVAWQDARNSSVNLDIYAQRVSGSGGISAVALGGPSYSFALHAPHPNPANAGATISFDLPSPQPVSVRVYDVTGRLVRTLAASGELPAGSHSLMWNGTSDSGTLAHSGIYFIRVNVGSAVKTRAVAIVR